MSEPLLSVENVRVLYGHFLAVEDVSFAMRGGELLGMIGPNGAGKTTLLRAMCGLLPIATGRITVLGNDVFKEPVEVGRHVAFAPDVPALYEGLTVTRYLEFIGDCYQLSRSACSERIDFWLEQLWLTDKRGNKVRELSRGMRQRLAVLRALLPDPYVVLLDEPAAGLDPAGRVEFRRLLAALRDQGKAVIVSSHILADLSEYCTHIMIMGHGRALDFGTVAQVTGHSDHTTCRYRLALAGPSADLKPVLDEIEGLRVVVLDSDVCTFDYASDRTAAAELLGRLIAAGLAVAEFHAVAPDLEGAYLRSGLGQVD